MDARYTTCKAEGKSGFALLQALQQETRAIKAERDTSMSIEDVVAQARARVQERTALPRRPLC